MKIAVIGGGINGIMTAWELCKHHHDVTLIEKNTLMSQTSSASSKLLHGGLRYLENFEFKLVKQALRERQWWINKAPDLALPLKIFIPVYKQSKRPAWLYKVGLHLYDLFSGKHNIGKHQNYSKASMQRLCPGLKTNNLVKGFSYYDGQMDDYKLGLWAVDQAKQYKNFTVLEGVVVDQVDVNGGVSFNGNKEQFDKVINIAGPWAHKLLKDSNVNSDYELDLIRGSHIVIDRKLDHGYFLEVPDERRIFFVLPYKDQTLIGTTEVRQKISDEIKPTQSEIIYLVNAYNHYFTNQIAEQDVINSFSGVRPLIKSSNDANKMTRECAIQVEKDLISVFGGKWTTSRVLSKKVAQILDQSFIK
jgi:glycerol-3-phosphate dehydrogenase